MASRSSRTVSFPSWFLHHPFPLLEIQFPFAAGVNVVRDREHAKRCMMRKIPIGSGTRSCFVGVVRWVRISVL
jgi:hypothetical protein